MVDLKGGGRGKGGGSSQGVPLPYQPFYTAAVTDNLHAAQHRLYRGMTRTNGQWKTLRVYQPIPSLDTRVSSPSTFEGHGSSPLVRSPVKRGQTGQTGERGQSPAKRQPSPVSIQRKPSPKAQQGARARTLSKKVGQTKSLSLCLPGKTKSVSP